MDDKAAPPRIFSARRRRFRWQRMVRVQQSADAPRFVLEAMAEEIADRVGFMKLEGRRALLIGDVTGELGSALAPSFAEITSVSPIQIDEEQPITDGPFDLVASMGTLDTVNDLPGALLHAERALAPGGIFMAVLPGAGSLAALRDAMLAADGERPAPRMHPMIDAQAATGLLQRAGFQRQVVDTQTISATYRSFARLIADLRAQGLGNALASISAPLGKAGLKRAAERFETAVNPEGKVEIRFELLALTGWKAS